VALSYNATNKYDPIDIPETVKTKGTFLTQARFVVDLMSVPVVTRNGRIRRTADSDDVQVTRFVLTDDKDNVYYASDTSASEVKSGTEQFSGVGVIQHTDTSQVNTSGSATAYGTGGTVQAYGNSTSTGTYHYNEYIPWSQSHPYYEARYTVSFALFDKDGKPVIKNDVKKITLHIIKPNGEQQVEYELKPPKI
jgi:hypothetical protein